MAFKLVQKLKEVFDNAFGTKVTKLDLSTPVAAAPAAPAAEAKPAAPAAPKN